MGVLQSRMEHFLASPKRREGGSRQLHVCPNFRVLPHHATKSRAKIPRRPVCKYAINGTFQPGKFVVFELCENRCQTKDHCWSRSPKECCQINWRRRLRAGRLYPFADKEPRCQYTLLQRKE